MRMMAQDGAFYRKIHVDLSDNPVARNRLGQLNRIKALREAGNPVAVAVVSQGISRATYYRWRRAFEAGGLKGLVPRSTRPHSHPGKRWTMQDARRIRTLREAHPYAGKGHLHHLHNQQYPDKPLCLATVGRIISWALKQGRIRPAYFQERLKQRCQRHFHGHAQRWRRSDYHQGIQIDHMTITRDSSTFKEFRAICPDTRRMCSRVFSSATARSAKTFLQRVLQTLDVRAIQVDGGSEFMGEFEQFCETNHIPLNVLPPRSPKLNGMVERANRTSRIECWGHYTGEMNCRAMNQHLDKWLDYYNCQRPHRSLGMKTPEHVYRMQQRLNN